jgi:hypothetical protein
MDRFKITILKSPVLTATILLMSLCCTYQTLAQSGSQSPRANVRLANEERKMIQVKTILANPKLVSAKPSCEVTSFVISFQPEGGEKYGPFRTEGATLKPEHCKYLKEKEDANVRIFLEHIHLSCNGQDVTEPTIIISSFP